MARKSVGKISTTEMLLIGGGALVVLLLVTKKTTTPVTTPVYVPIPSGGGSGLSSQQYVQLGTSLANALSDIFG